MNKNRKNLHRVTANVMGLTLASVIAVGSTVDAAAPVTVFAAEQKQTAEKTDIKTIYLNGSLEKTAENADGTSKKKAVNTLEKALELAEGNAVIFVCRTVVISNEKKLVIPEGVTFKKEEENKKPLVKITGEGKLIVTGSTLPTEEVDVSEAKLGKEAFVIEKPEEPEKEDQEDKEARPEEPKKEEDKEVKPEEPEKEEDKEVKPEEPKKEEDKEVKPEEPKKEEDKEVKPEEPKKEEDKEEVKPEEPKKEEDKEVKPEEPKKEEDKEVKPEEPKKEEDKEVKPEEPKKEEEKKPEVIITPVEEMEDAKPEEIKPEEPKKEEIVFSATPGKTKEAATKAPESIPVGSLLDETGVQVYGDFIPYYVDLQVSYNEAVNELPDAGIGEILSAYELKLWDLKEDEEYKIPEGKKVKVMIPLPENAGEFSDIAIAHYLGNNEYEYFTFDKEGKNGNMTIEEQAGKEYLTFATASFSPFNVGGHQIVGPGTSSGGHKAPVKPSTGTSDGNKKPDAGNETGSSNTGTSNGGGNKVTTGKPDDSSSGSNAGDKNSGTTNNGSSNGSAVVRPVQTGDNTSVIIYLITGAAALALAAVTLVLGKKKK